MKERDVPFWDTPVMTFKHKLAILAAFLIVPHSVFAMPSFTYDPAGNRTQLIQGGVTTTYSTNSLNQLTQELIGAIPQVTYQYDANGNRTKRQTSTVTETLGYDFDNRGNGTRFRRDRLMRWRRGRKPRTWSEATTASR